MRQILLALAPIIFIALGVLTYTQYKVAPTNPNSPIKIIDAYAFSTLPGATTGAAFMQIKNTGNNDDRLISALSDIAEINEIHQNLIDPDDGTMMMRKIKEIIVPAANEITLEPKGYHVMFIKLKRPLTIDETFPMTLNFEHAGSVKTNIKIIAPGTAFNSNHKGRNQ